jgi:hypothetical protein
MSKYYDFPIKRRDYTDDAHRVSAPPGCPQIALPPSEARKRLVELVATELRQRRGGSLYLNPAITKIVGEYIESTPFRYSRIAHGARRATPRPDDQVKILVRTLAEGFEQYHSWDRPAAPVPAPPPVPVPVPPPAVPRVPDEASASSLDYESFETELGRAAIAMDNASAPAVQQSISRSSDLATFIPTVFGSASTDTEGPTETKSLAKDLRNAQTMAISRHIAFTVNSIHRNFGLYAKNNCFSITFNDSTTKVTDGTDGCYFAGIRSITRLLHLKLEKVYIPYSAAIFAKNPRPFIYVSFSGIDPIQRAISGRVPSQIYHTFTLVPSNFTNEGTSIVSVEFTPTSPDGVAFPGNEEEIRESTIRLIGDNGKLLEFPQDRISIVNVEAVDAGKTRITTAENHGLRSGHLITILNVSGTVGSADINSEDGHVVEVDSDTSFVIDVALGTGTVNIADAYLLNTSNCVKMSIVAYVQQ